MGLMLLWANDFRAVFWVAIIPGLLAVLVLAMGVREPERAAGAPRVNPIRGENLRRLSPNYWWVVAIGAMLTLARFSEAFLVLRAQQGGLPLALAPLVLIVMSNPTPWPGQAFAKKRSALQGERQRRDDRQVNGVSVAAVTAAEVRARA